MSNTIVPIYGHGRTPVRQQREATADMFGTPDELKRQSSAIHARACIQFLNGERHDPEISDCEMGDMLAQAPYERRFGDVY